jgi:hypothetical protein
MGGWSGIAGQVCLLWSSSAVHASTSTADQVCLFADVCARIESVACHWALRTKPALNAFAITFEGRIVPSTTN